MTDITLYDLEFLNKPKAVVSPNVAKIRYALNLKKLPYKVEWVNFLNIKEIIPPITKNTKDRPLVPVMIDSGKVITDSWDIALYLEEKYPENSLFNGNIGVHKFFQNYSDKNIILPLYKLSIVGECDISGPSDFQEYFRQDRETMMGMTLEEFAGDEQENLKAAKEALVPVHQLLSKYPYVTGDKPGWADIVLASTFIFVAGVSFEVFEKSVLNAFGEEDNVIRSWWDRMEEIRK